VGIVIEAEFNKNYYERNSFGIDIQRAGIKYFPYQYASSILHPKKSIPCLWYFSSSIKHGLIRIPSQIFNVILLLRVYQLKSGGEFCPEKYPVYGIV
jgi:hypothetical protein